MLEREEEFYEESSMGIAKALTLFFGLALVCGILFGIGYSVGKSAGQSQIAAAAPSVPSSTSYEPTTKPGAAQPTVADTASAPLAELTTPTPLAPEPSPNIAERSAKKSVAADPKPEHSAPAIVASGVAVQVAAVRHEEDAEALAAALRKKDYPVYLANPAGDALFHVQVGPFHDVKEAEGIKQRLAADGYNAIVKK